MSAGSRESACQNRRHKSHGFDPWVEKILWRKVWQPTPVFLPGEAQTEVPGMLQSMGLQSQTQLDRNSHVHDHPSCKGG